MHIRTHTVMYSLYGGPAVRDAGGHRALRSDPCPSRPRPLRMPGPAGGRAHPEERRTGRRLKSAGRILPVGTEGMTGQWPWRLPFHADSRP